MANSQENAQLAHECREGTGLNNDLDVRIECALFRPCDQFVSIRPNAAGTKVIYSREDGSSKTFWAQEWSGKRAETARLLDGLATERTAAEA